MSQHYESELDLFQMLAEISDPEDRERTRREWGLVDYDLRGRRRPYHSPTYGRHASINRAIVKDYQTSPASRPFKRPARSTQSEKVPPDIAQPGFLSRENTRRLYDAASLLVQEHGFYFNAFITITYKEFGLESSSEMPALLTNFLDEADGQMRRWGYPWHWMYVHENSAEHGLHTHILATVDKSVRGALMEWATVKTRSFVERHAAEPSDNAIDFDIKVPASTHSAAQWQRDRIQYMVKTLDPALLDRDVTDGKVKPLIDLLGIRERYRNRRAAAIPFKKNVGFSRSIGDAARAQLAKDQLPVLQRSPIMPGLICISIISRRLGNSRIRSPRQGAGDPPITAICWDG